MHNADTSELNKFNRLSDQWWDPTGEFKTLHEINPLRLSYVIQHSGALKNKKVIDVGCGGGLLAESFAKQGAEVTALDLAEDVLDVAKKHAAAENLNINYQLQAVETLAEQEIEQYDVVSCMEMLEHVPDPSAVVTACAKLCKPGGHIFFSTINRNAKAFFLAIVSAEYVLNLVPRGTHEYDKFIRPSELAAWARNTNINVSNISGLHYNPITNNHRINRDPAVNYLMHCQKPHSNS